MIYAASFTCLLRTLTPNNRLLHNNSNQQQLESEVRSLRALAFSRQVGHESVFSACIYRCSNPMPLEPRLGLRQYVVFAVG